MTLSTPITGGCQCGAVRYSVSVQLEKAHICHCRMCQKAAGNYFMPFATASRDAFEFSRGEPTWFHSCDPVKRGFCNRCGTPLVLDDTREEPIYIVLGSLDDPASVPPQYQSGIEGRYNWFDAINDLPGNTTEGDDDSPPQWVTEIRESNHQHPDHETDAWEIKS